MARDSSGRFFNVEVQTRLPLCFPNRLLYYNCRNYWQQLHEGHGYEADQKWLFLFTRAAEMEADQLSKLLGDEPYREAIGVLEMISKSPEDYQYYEDRLKFLRDEEAKLADARLEGLEQGLETGKLVGNVQMLQELLGLAVTGDRELRALSNTQLRMRLTELQQQLRDRSA